MNFPEQRIVFALRSFHLVKIASWISLLTLHKSLIVPERFLRVSSISAVRMKLEPSLTSVSEGCGSGVIFDNTRRFKEKDKISQSEKYRAQVEELPAKWKREV
jgi:hypothetical protein